MGGNRYIPAFRVIMLRFLGLGGVVFRRGRLVQSPLLNRLLFLPFLADQEKAAAVGCSFSLNVRNGILLRTTHRRTICQIRALIIPSPGEREEAGEE